MHDYLLSDSTVAISYSYSQNPFFLRVHHLCSRFSNIKPSFCDSEPYREGESKVLSDSKPNINRVTSPRAEML